MKQFLKWTGFVLFAALLLGSAGFLIWAETPSQARPAALAALKSDGEVTVTDTGKYITFQPSNLPPSTGLIFYPGGPVDYRAYAPILRQIAARGIFVALVRVRLNLAVFDIESGAPALADFPQIKVWVAGGHSQGGVAAAWFAQNHPQIRGIVFWASYPADDQLKNSGVKALSVYATNDALAPVKAIEASQANLPADTLFVAIEGGNHGQFGDYGPQPGDNPATISAEEQWQQTSQATVNFLQSIP